MKLSRDQKREELEKAASELIERMLDWDEAKSAPNLTEIEDEVLKLRKQFGEELMRTVLEGQESQQPSEPPKCQGCGKRLSDKGRKGKSVESRVGELKVERNYYYCKECKRGLFPPG